MSFSRKAVAALIRSGKLEEADRLCREELEVNPGNADAWHQAGNAAIHKGEFNRAAQYLLRSIFHRPGVCETHVNLGIALRALQRFDEAAAALSDAAELDPSNFESRILLALTCVAREELDAASTAIAAALELQPRSAEALAVRAMIAHRRGNSDQAFGDASAAISINPAVASAQRIIGDIETRRENYGAAVEAYRAALRFEPDDIETRGNFGVSLARMGHHGAAAHQLLRAVSSAPDPQIEYSLAVTLLALGQFKQGWSWYGRRETVFKVVRPAQIPRLDRLPKMGERVLLTTDQGLGEQILFASLLPDLQQTGAHLFVASDERLVPLLARSFPEITFVGQEEADDRVDCQIGLADTARWLRRSFNEFPRTSGYLKADPNFSKALRARYRGAHGNRPLIGISWRSDLNAKVSSQKSIPLQQWDSVLGTPDLTFVSLQYGDSDPDIRSANARGLKILKDAQIDATNDLDALAAQIAAMDLVITTSNTTAHLAGALNVTTWVLVPLGYGGLWHWFLDRNDSPWYRSVRLFRQREPGNWQHPKDELAAALRQYAGGRPTVS